MQDYDTSRLDVGIKTAHLSDGEQQNKQLQKKSLNSQVRILNQKIQNFSHFRMHIFFFTFVFTTRERTMNKNI
jgi:hypothetical protein